MQYINPSIISPGGRPLERTTACHSVVVEKLCRNIAVCFWFRLHLINQQHRPHAN